MNAQCKMQTFCRGGCRATSHAITLAQHARTLGSGLKYEFDADTAIEKSADGSLRAFVTDRWSVAQAPNGGMLMAMCISAMRTAQPFRDPLSLTTHFLRAASENEPADLDVTVLKVGRRAATATVTLSQAGEPRLCALCSFGDLSQHDGVTLRAGEAVLPPQGSKNDNLPPPDQCVRGNPQLRPDVRIAERAELLVAPDSDWAQGLCSGCAGTEPTFEGWLRFADGRPPCLRSLALFSDVTPPPILNVVPNAKWVPTMEMTTHFRARPHPCEGGWLAVRARAVHVCDGMLATDHEVWDTAPAEHGGPRLCAMSRQLAKLIE